MPYNTLSRYCTTIRRNPSLVVTYHSTDIVSVDPDDHNKVTLKTGGWLSATTKRKINAAIDEFSLFNGHSVYVTQKKGEWFIHVNSYAMPWDGSPITLDMNSGLFTLDSVAA